MNKIKQIKKISSSAFESFNNKVIKTIQEKVRTVFFNPNMLTNQLDNLDLDE
ncbi:35988_t:CDS:1, partial [Gigaspora margarita]